VDNNADIKGPS